MFFQKSTSSAPEFILCGLGNPGREYERSRHNAGFVFLDALADRMGVSVRRLKFQSLCGDGDLQGHRCLLLKPQTYMNNSGQAVREAAAFYKIPPERVIVVFDDITLEPGVLRIRRKGSDGGHNGIKSILYHLESDRFPRIKLGVGCKPHPDYDLAKWVLSSMPEGDRVKLQEAAERACDAAELMVQGEIDQAMNRFSH